MKLLLTSILTILLLFLVTSLLNAQGLPGLPDFPDNPSPAPIDGGLGLLAVAGGAYAYKKLKQQEDRNS